MAASNQHIIVPIKVEALVIEQKVCELAKKTVRDGFVDPADGKWSPRGSDWKSSLENFERPGPATFFGAEFEDGHSFLPSQSPYLPHATDTGIYVHWVLKTLEKAVKWQRLKYHPIHGQKGQRADGGVRHGDE